MADDSKTLSQTYYEAVERLKAAGTSNADAVRQVATEMGKTERTVRAGIYQYKGRQDQTLPSSPTSRRRRGRPPRSAVSVDDVIADARAILERALGGIDGDIGAAKAELDAAQARYDQLIASAKERRDQLAEKIKALS